jgi:putative ABC transport system permease protein
MRSILWDLRYGCRALLRRPGLASIAVLSLAIGIGANTAIFTFVNGALLEPLPVRNARQLVIPTVISPDGHEIGLSIPDFKDWREGSQSFQNFGGNLLNWRTLTGGSQPEVVAVREILGDFFEALDATPALGRLIGSDETWSGAAPVAVISHGFWQRQLGGERNVLGQTLTLDGRAFEIVGVTPPNFQFVPAGTEIYLPLGVYAEDLCWEDRYCTEGLRAVAELKDGTTIEMAQADLDRVTDGIAEVEGRPVSTAELHTLSDVVVGGMRIPVWILMGAVVCVLLISIANVAALLLSWGESRRLEIALRMGLGAGRRRLIRQLLTESVILSLVAATLGVGIAFGGVRLLLHSVAQHLPSLIAGRIGIDLRVLGFTVTTAIVAGLVLGIVPAVRASGVDLSSTLKEGGRGTGGIGRQRMRSVLVTAEIALALVLLIGAGLMIRSLVNLHSVETGFVAEGVLTAEVSLPRLRYENQEKSREFFEELRGRTARLPGVVAAAVTNAVPLSGMSWDMGVLPEGIANEIENRRPTLYYMVSPDYFQVLGIKLIQGRGFDDSDRDGSNPICIVDETLAEAFWPGENPVGKRLTLETREGATPEERIPVYRTVVGVVGHVRQYELETRSLIQVYVPFAQSGETWSTYMTLMVKNDGDLPGVADQIRNELREIDADVPLVRVRTMTDHIDRLLSGNRFLGGLLAVFSAVALILSAIGIFGVAWYSATRRRHEIGIRITLGARPANVVRTLSKRAVVVTLSGIAIGLLVAVALSRILAGLLYQVEPVDPSTYAQLALFLATVSLLATCIPAIAATRVDPISVLREE